MDHFKLFYFYFKEQYENEFELVIDEFQNIRNDLNTNKCEMLDKMLDERDKYQSIDIVDYTNYCINDFKMYFDLKNYKHPQIQTKSDYVETLEWRYRPLNCMKQRK